MNLVYLSWVEFVRVLDTFDGLYWKDTSLLLSGTLVESCKMYPSSGGLALVGVFFGIIYLNL